VAVSSGPPGHPCLEERPIYDVDSSLVGSPDEAWFYGAVKSGGFSVPKMCGAFSRARLLEPHTALLRRYEVNRSIVLALNQFAVLPPKLAGIAGQLATGAEIVCDVKSVMHHYFLAKFGASADDRGSYEYEGFLTDGPDWRFRGRGIGADKESKRNVSNELAKGLARWFFDNYLDFTYFCPFENLVGRVNDDGSRWKRAEDGDLPDYVCGRGVLEPNLLEVKGRYESVTFTAKKFSEFRAQIQRAELVDSNGASIQVKGFVSVARWATQDTPRVRTRLLVEDPATRGEQPGADGFPRAIGRAMVRGHYGPVLALLRLPLHAEAIRSGRTIVEQTGATRGIWECVGSRLKGRRFVGGLLPDGAGWGCALPWSLLNAEILGAFWHAIQWSSPFVLAPTPQFFGLEEHIMKTLLDAMRLEREPPDIPIAEVPQDLDALSLHRDGTVLGPADYFRPIGVLRL
jgi:hypothetical protein